MNAECECVGSTILSNINMCDVAVCFLYPPIYIKDKIQHYIYTCVTRGKGSRCERRLYGVSRLSK